MTILEENRDRMNRMDRMTKWRIKNCKRRLAWRIQRDKGRDGLTIAGWGTRPTGERTNGYTSGSVFLRRISIRVLTNGYFNHYDWHFFGWFSNWVPWINP